MIAQPSLELVDSPRRRWPPPALPRLAERLVRRVFQRAAIPIDDARCPYSLRVRDRRFYRRVLVDGTLGLGEAYVDGWWECDAVDELTARLCRALGGDGETRLFGGLYELGHGLAGRVLNRQRARRAALDVAAHYDRDEALFAAMLDKRLIYSCAYWKRARTLDDAQEDKLDLVCRKLGLRAGQRVLDLGCGWGGFARYAVERYGVRVVGVTVARRQGELAARRCAGLPVEIRVQDYRSVAGRFDRIVSLGMLEHVGPRNHATYMRVLHRCLVPDGLALVQVIGSRRSTAHIDPWMDRYIFPNAVLPSVAQLGAAMEPWLVLEDWHNFGADYDRTLLCWHDNFERRWPELSGRYRPSFARLWRYYLLSCAGAFRARHTQLWQLVLSPRGVAGGYESLR